MIIDKRLIAACFAAVLLTACGGDDDDDDNDVDVTAEVPDSASERVDDFIDYLKKLVVASADTLEPVDVSAVTPPTSISREPESLTD